MLNCLGKVWTGWIAKTLSTIAEQRQMLSTTQEGFRGYRDCQRQIRNVLNIIEDAHLHHQNLYMMYIDLTAAFNTVDHTRMQDILTIHDVPQDIKDIIAGLYTRAHTCIITPSGNTKPIPITRGTLQGDTLSPLLFLLYIEPLLKWLHHGGLGYSFKCLEPTKGTHQPYHTPAATNERHQMASAAFADDLGIMTNSLSNLQQQAHKVTKFCDWAKLTVNHTKCAVTAGTFELWEQHKSSTNPKKDTTLKTRLMGKVSIQGKALPVLSQMESYIYLGIPLNIMLDWTPAYKLLEARITKKRAGTPGQPHTHSSQQMQNH